MANLEHQHSLIAKINNNDFLLLIEEMVYAEMNKQFDIPIEVQKMMIDRKKSALMHPEKLVDWHTAKVRIGIK